MCKNPWNPSLSIWKAILWLGLLFIIAGLVSPVLADYLGPNRTVTTYIWERSTCTYLATKSGGSCSLTLYYPPHDCVAASLTAGFFNNSPTACGAGWGGTCGVNFSCSISLTGDTVGGCSQGEPGCTSTEHTTTYPPATVSGSVNCSQTGDNGWCIGVANLGIAASEPLGGQSITVIEGTHNGTPFSCSGASCEVSLLEGQNDFTFWAHSTFGDTSSMGSASGKVDSQPPQVSLSGASSVCPDCGESLNVTLNVSDATSGVSSWTLSLDGASLTSGSGSASQTVPVPSTGLSAGSHTLALSASDVAGNTNATTLTFTLLLPTPTPTFTPLPTHTATSLPSGGGALQGNEPASQIGSSQPQATPTLGPSVTPGGESTILPTNSPGEEQASIIENTEPEQAIGAGSGGGGAPLDGDMLSTLALLGATAGGLGAMALYLLGKQSSDLGSGESIINTEILTNSNQNPGNSSVGAAPLPQEIPNMVIVEYPYTYQWTEIRQDVLVETYMGSKIEKVLARAGFYMQSEPYKDFITRTSTKSGSITGTKEGAITKIVPYIAYEQIWIPPVYKNIVKDIYEYRPMEIVQEETRWDKVTVDAGDMPVDLVIEFFKNQNSHLVVLSLNSETVWPKLNTETA